MRWVLLETAQADDSSDHSELISREEVLSVILHCSRLRRLQFLIENLKHHFIRLQYITVTLRK